MMMQSAILFNILVYLTDFLGAKIEKEMKSAFYPVTHHGTTGSFPNPDINGTSMPT